MSVTSYPFLIPYFISFIISAWVGVITFRRREVVGAKLYSLVAFGQALSTLGYIFELGSISLESKIFWDDFQWLGLMIWAYLIPIFALQFTGSEHANRRQTWALLAVIPVSFLALLVTNPLHGWVHTGEWLEQGNHFNALRYDFTPPVWAFAVYGYLSMILAFAHLMVKYFKTHRIYRFQVGAVVLGSGVPLIGYVLSLMDIQLSFQRDISPLTLAIGNLIVAWGLLRQRLFDIIPIARDLVVDNMEDMVIVVDAMDRVVDLNLIAEAQFVRGGKSAVGQTLREFFSYLRGSVVQMGDLDKEGQSEVVVEVDGRMTYIDMRVTKIRDKRGGELGRVLVARNVTARKEMEEELRQLNNQLEQRVQDRTRELEEAYELTLEGWAKALEIRDKETEGHSRRVTELSINLAKKLGVNSNDIADIRRGALIHDLGKMGIPDEILHKPGKLNAEEWEIMRTHPSIGHDLLKHIPYLEKALDITCYHHERWDGQGYPGQIKGEEIPLNARIFTVIDNWDALLSDRPYRKAWEREKVIEYMRENRGKMFDPEVLDAFFEMMGIEG